MTRVIWTEEHDMAMAAMRWNGATNAQIGARFGVSAKAVSERMRRLGHRPSSQTLDRRTVKPVEASTVETEAMLRSSRQKQIAACERHAEAVMAEGGFCAFSEKPLGAGKWAVCLPLIWPARAS